MSDHIMSQGQGAPGKNGSPGSNHSHVDQPTDWVSSITYIQKANDEFCLCLDLCDLNRAIHHDHHKMPTVEEVTHKFANSCITSPSLITHHGYWSIVLDEESSLLTTFNSPFGRYRFLHLPFWSSLLTGHLPEEDGPIP